MQEIYINTEFIKLDSFLKLSGCAQSGGDAKMLIRDLEVKVNGEVCSMRGKKLYPGDKVEYDNEIFMVSAKCK